ALGELWPTTREQRCWVHKTANVLNKLTKSQQPKAKRSLQEIWMAETSKDAETAFDAFIAAYQLKYDRAAELPGEGSPSPARLLRFPGRALETPADLEPNREHLCYRAAPHNPREGLPVEQDGARDGVQARQRGAEKLAQARWPQPVAQAHSRCQVHRRDRRRRQPGVLAIPNRRRLILQAITKIRR